MKIRFLLPISMLFAFSVSAQNVLISDQNFPSEPSIMMDYEHPQYMVAGAVLNHVYMSTDTGHTWSTKQLYSPYGVWGDPVIDVDTAGNFYYFHLSNPQDGEWIDRIVCQKSTDQGETWSEGTYTGLNGSKDQDKHWSAIDRETNIIYLTWTQFDKYGSTDPPDSTHIMFSKSNDGGETWTTAKRIDQTGGDCIDSDNTVEGAVPAIGPNGEVYVAWAGPAGIRFDRSLDQGETWLENDILVDPMPTGWDYSIPGIYRANGLPVTKCDISGGEHHGTIYVNWTDQRNGPDDTDVWLAKSTDGGDNWTGPVRINDDSAGSQQFFTWMDVDQTTGYLYFVFYDRRAYDNELTDVYLAISKDGGETFENRKISESPFLPNSSIFFGDYTNIIAHDHIVRPIWARLHQGVLSIWTDVTPMDPISSAGAAPEIKKAEIQQYPNPASKVAYVSYKLHQEAAVSLALFDQQGKKLKTLLDNETRGYGKYVETIDLEALQLEPGVYYYELTIDGEVKTMKMVTIE